MWSSEMTSKPRATSLLVASGKSASSYPPFLRTLVEALRTFSGSEVQHFLAKRDKRDPDFTFYDSSTAVMHAYRVKPAVFDLVITVCIVGYLGLIYLVLQKWSDVVYVFLASINGMHQTSNGGRVSSKQEIVNGHGKVKSN